MDDISGRTNIDELYKNSNMNKWIKRIPIYKTVLFTEYHKNKDFVYVADIILDNETYTSGKKKRRTLIQFIPKIPIYEFNEKREWLYIFTINGRIVKIGGTRVGLQGRTASYLCGHHVKERGKSGDCSKTNAFIYNTFVFYLEQGCKIEMYGYPLQKKEYTVYLFDEKITIPVQTYHVYESVYLQKYKQEYHDYPFLCDNCDPNYKLD
jgi:hypothetical protein